MPKLIAYVSTFTPLSPGDVIVTGTPGGVGMKRDPQVFMKEGDRIEIEIDSVGTLVEHDHAARLTPYGCGDQAERPSVPASMNSV